MAKKKTVSKAETKTAKTAKKTAKEPKSPKREKTVFAKYLEKKGLDTAGAAEALDLTRSYVHMLKSGAATPGLKLAVKIEQWSRRNVPCKSWVW